MNIIININIYKYKYTVVNTIIVYYNFIQKKYCQLHQSMYPIVQVSGHSSEYNDFYYVCQKGRTFMIDIQGSIFIFFFLDIQSLYFTVDFRRI